MWTTVATKTMITEVETMETWTCGSVFVVSAVTAVTESVISEVESVITWSAAAFVFHLVVAHVVFNSTMVPSTMVSVGESVEVSVSTVTALFSTLGMITTVVTAVVTVFSFLFCSVLLTTTMVSAFVSAIWMTAVPDVVFVSFVVPAVTNKVTAGMFDLRPDLFFLCSLYVHVV
jgi:hypothetical protein